jgi:AraC-like DNA-binding protein
MSMPANEAVPDGDITIGGSDLLPRHSVFRTRDLEHARRHNYNVFVEHALDYLPRERHLDFRHRQAKLGPITINVMQYGAGVVIKAPPFTDFYLLQFTLAGECQVSDERHHNILPAGSVAIINPFQAFKKVWLPGTRQLLLRVDRQLLEREFQAWTGCEEAGDIEFDTSPIRDTVKVGTLTRYVQMLCDDLGAAACDLSRPLVADRVASGLASLLLASMPHNRTAAIESPGRSIAPFFVRRVEQFIERHARDTIVLADLIGVGGVSTRALQTGFRRSRNTTPMKYLRAIRLELARTDLANAASANSSVAMIANALGFGHLGRFARDYEERFGELPSETLRRGSVGRTR